MNAKRILIGLLAAIALSWAPAVVYAGNSTEFGVAGDLSVYGVNGTLVDPDVKIKGFTVFGSTQTAYEGMPSLVPGGVVVNSALAVSSGAYFVGGSTFAAGGAYFTDVSSFTAGPSKIFVNGGADGQVMTYNGATGALQWSDVSNLVHGDNLGNHIATTTLQMQGFDVHNAGYITASSEAVSGELIVYSSSTLTGNTGVGGTLAVTGDTSLNGKLNVNGASTFVSSVTVNGDSQLGSAYANKHGINMAPDATTALSVAGQATSNDYVAKFYSGAALAAWIRTK